MDTNQTFPDIWRLQLTEVFLMLQNFAFVSHKIETISDYCVDLIIYIKKSFYGKRLFDLLAVIDLNKIKRYEIMAEIFAIIRQNVYRIAFI